jgi:membrane-associated phospholipid phosphatase
MGFELDFIKWLQSFRSGFLDVVFQLFTMLGEELVIIGILGFLYWCYDKKVGEKVGITVFISLVLNSSIKTLFKRLRPFQVDGAIVNVRPQTSSGYAFPSGHTQGAATVFTSAALWLKKKGFLIGAFVITFLVAMSRMYIGVHYLTDVLVGAALGIGISYAMMAYYKKVSDPAKGYKTILYASVALLVIVFIYHLLTIEAEGTLTDAGTFYDRMEGGFKMVGSMVGFVIGIGFEQSKTKFEHHRVWWKNLIRFGLGVGIVMGVRLGLSFIFDFIVDPEHLATGQFLSATIAMVLDMIRYFAMVFVAIGVYPMLFKKINI